MRAASAAFRPDLCPDPFDVGGGYMTGEVGHGVRRATGGAERARVVQRVATDEPDDKPRGKRVARADGTARRDSRDADAPRPVPVARQRPIGAERNDNGTAGGAMPSDRITQLVVGIEWTANRRGELLAVQLRDEAAVVQGVSQWLAAGVEDDRQAGPANPPED